MPAGQPTIPMASALVVTLRNVLPKLLPGPLTSTPFPWYLGEGGANDRTKCATQLPQHEESPQCIQKARDESEPEALAPRTWTESGDLG